MSKRETIAFSLKGRLFRVYYELPFHNPVREELPTIRELSSSGSNRNVSEATSVDSLSGTELARYAHFDWFVSLYTRPKVSFDQGIA